MADQVRELLSSSLVSSIDWMLVENMAFALLFWLIIWDMSVRSSTFYLRPSEEIELSM